MSLTKNELALAVERMAYGYGVLTLNGDISVWTAGRLVRVDLGDGKGRIVGEVGHKGYVEAMPNHSMPEFVASYCDFHNKALLGKSHRQLKVTSFRGV